MPHVPSVHRNISTRETGAQYQHHPCIHRDRSTMPHVPSVHRNVSTRETGAHNDIIYALLIESDIYHELTLITFITLWVVRHVNKTRCTRPVTCSVSMFLQFSSVKVQSPCEVFSGAVYSVDRLQYRSKKVRKSLNSKPSSRMLVQRACTKNQAATGSQFN